MTKPTCTISHWQIHTVACPLERLRSERPDVKIDKVLIVTGTVVDDEQMRWQPGYHMRSTIAVDYNEETGIFETSNTIYKLTDPQGDMIPDLGSDVMRIFY